MIAELLLGQLRVGRGRCCSSGWAGADAAFSSKEGCVLLAEGFLKHQTVCRDPILPNLRQVLGLELLQVLTCGNNDSLLRKAPRLLVHLSAVAHVLTILKAPLSPGIRTFCTHTHTHTHTHTRVLLCGPG